MANSDSTIYLLSNLKVDKTISFNENKNITLSSYSDNYSLMRADNMSAVDSRYNILTISNGKLVVKNLTFDGENKEMAGTLLLVKNNSEATLGKNAIFQNNVDTEDFGGGCTFSDAGNVVIDGAKFLNNVAQAGGGGAFLARRNDVTINNVEIDGNSALNGGAIFFGDKTLTINDANIINNVATRSNGGAIYIASATLIMNGGIISNNTAENNGGGIILSKASNVEDASGSKFILNDGTISNNTAKVYGGGVALGTGAKSYLEINGGTINNNKYNSAGKYEYTKDIYVDSTYGAEVKDTITKPTLSFDTATKYYIDSALGTNIGAAVSGAYTDNGSKIVMWSHGGNNHRWKIVMRKVYDGKVEYSFQVCHTDKYLWVGGNSSTSGAGVVIWDFHNANGGRWYLQNAGTGYYFKNINGLCMASANSGTSNGNNIIGYTCRQSNEQKWKFTP